MTTVAQPIGMMNSGHVVLTLHYDDVTLLIQDVTCVNTALSGTFTVTLYNRITDAIIPGFPKSYAANSGTTVTDLTPLNAHMLHETGIGKFGPYDMNVPPVKYALGFKNS